MAAEGVVLQGEEPGNMPPVMASLHVLWLPIIAGFMSGWAGIESFSSAPRLVSALGGSLLALVCWVACHVSTLAVQRITGNRLPLIPLLALGVEGERVEGLFVQEQIDPREPTADERAVGAQVLAAIPGDVPLYARVDLIAGPDGTPSLLELELTEPSLFLSFADGAPARLADAISRRLAR